MTRATRWVLGILLLWAGTLLTAVGPPESAIPDAAVGQSRVSQQSPENAAKQSAGCITCHTKTDEAVDASRRARSRIGCAIATAATRIHQRHERSGEQLQGVRRGAGARRTFCPRNTSLWKSSANADRVLTAPGWQSRRSTSSSSIPATCGSSTGRAGRVMRRRCATCAPA